MTDSITLKWGTLKGWSFGDSNQKAIDLLNEAFSESGQSMSAIGQKHTANEREKFCEAIDAFEGEIWNDWDGVKMTKDEAKKYIREYNS